jgi:hypothetical protein
MESNREDNTEKDKQYGIHKIYRFSNEIKSSNQDICILDDKKHFINLEKITVATVVKLEFTTNNCFVLLSNGKVYSKGRKMCIGRECQSEKTKEFGEIYFPLNKSDEGKDGNIKIFNISAGDEHVLALDSNHTVWGWGKNDNRQILHNNTKDEIEKPVRITLPSGTKVYQVYALYKSSLVVCEDNKIYMWGSVAEGFLGDLKQKGDYVYDAKCPNVKMITDRIHEVMNKSPENFTENFINSRKLLNTKYNKTLEDNQQKSKRIDDLKNQIKNVEKEIEKRNEQNSKKIDLLSKALNENNEKKIKILRDLLTNYESELKEIAKRKDECRKQLINIEEEIKQKTYDLDSSNSQIEKVEDEIEKYSNEMTSLESQRTHETTKYKEYNEKKTNRNNFRIYRESLINNIQVIIHFLEEKQKEKKEITLKIKQETDRENQILTSRYTVEDMIMVVQESSLNIAEQENKKKNASDHTEKTDFLDLFDLSNKLDNASFIELDKKFPYKLISDILEHSEQELKKVEKKRNEKTSIMPESKKANLKILLDMIETKINLIREQNSMIENLSNIFKNLENEIKTRFPLEINKNTQSSFKETDIAYYSNSEFIFKDILKKSLDDAYKTGKSRYEEQDIEAKEAMLKDENKYIQEKKLEISKIQERNKMFSNFRTNIDFDELKSINENIDKSASSFEWGL